MWQTFYYPSEIVSNSTLDAMDENADLMPIGGGTNTPIDVAPEPLRLDPISVDAAIAGIMQSEEVPSAPSAPNVKSMEDPLKDKENDEVPDAARDTRR